MLESVPFWQTRDCEAQVCPKGTEDDWYAVTDALCATVCPLKEQADGEPTVQDE